MILPALHAPQTLAALFLAGALSLACENDGALVQEQDKSSPASSTATSPTASTTGEVQRLSEVPVGIWAGPHVVLTVTPSGATAEFDCAAGVVTEPLSVDGDGRFDVAAEHTLHTGGPASTNDARAPPLSARYRGRLIDAQHLTFAFELSRSGETAGPFELELGGEPLLERCV